MILAIDHSKFISQAFLLASCYYRLVIDLWLAISPSLLVPAGVLPVIGLASFLGLPHHPGLIAHCKATKTGRLGMIETSKWPLYAFILLSLSGASTPGAELVRVKEQHTLL